VKARQGSRRWGKTMPPEPRQDRETTEDADGQRRDDPDPGGEALFFLEIGLLRPLLHWGIMRASGSGCKAAA
jgi:hypothetical protein